MKKLGYIVLGILGITLLGFSFYNNGTTTEKTFQSTPITSPIFNTNNLAQVAGSKQIKNLNLEGGQVIYVLDEIGENSAYIAESIRKLYANKKPIYILINSPGGSVIDGAQIVTAIAAAPVPVVTVCLQLCASMAAIIHGYGSERLMVDRSILMHHPASGGVQGTLEQMGSRLGMITRYVNKMDADIGKRAGLSLEQFKAMTVSELWLDAEDALDKKLADGIVTVTVSGNKPALNLGNTNGKQSKFQLTW